MRYTGPDRNTLTVVRSRNHSLCLRCSVRPGEQTHHRLPRGMGGTTSNPAVNRPDALVWVCFRCHDHIERNRSESYARGWLVRHGIDEPYQIPLTDLAGGMFFLSQEGGIVPLAQPGQPPF